MNNNLNNLSIEELNKRAEELAREIYETREAIKNLKEKRIELFNQISKLRQERAKLLEEIRGIKTKLKTAREERRKLIEEYRKLVEERRENVLQVRAIKDLLSSKASEVQSLQNQTKEIRVPISVIKQKIDEIEWTIQTNVLTPEKENELIRKLKAYNALLKRVTAIRESLKEKKEEVLELRATYMSLRARIKELDEK